MDMTGFCRVAIKGVQLIPVAAPSHPLAQVERGCSAAGPPFRPTCSFEAPSAESRDYGVISLNTWRVGDLSVRHGFFSRWTRVERNAGTSRSCR